MFKSGIKKASGAVGSAAKEGNWKALFGYLVVLVVGYHLFKGMMKNMFSDPPNEEEQAKLALLKALYINWDNVSLTESEIKTRANNIHSAMDGVGTDEVLIAKQLIKKEYASQIDLENSSLSQGSVSASFDFFFTGSLPTGATYKSAYKAHEHIIGLNKDELTAIAVEYGIRGYGMVMNDYYTLAEALRDETEGDWLDLFEYVFRNTEINV